MLKRTAGLVGALLLGACTPPLAEQDRTYVDKAFSNGFNLDVLAYDWDETRAEQIEARLADAVNGILTIPARQSTPQAFLRNGRARVLVERELKARRLPRHSLAGSTALLYGVAWEIANQDTLEPWQHTALLNQAATEMRSTYRTAGDRRRQMESELRIGLAALWLEEARSRREDPAQMTALSDAVHIYMLTQGGDLRKHIVTEEGFADRPGSKVTS